MSINKGNYRILDVDVHTNFILDQHFCSCSIKVDKHDTDCPNYGQTVFGHFDNSYVDITYRYASGDTNLIRYHISKIEEIECPKIKKIML